MLLWVAVRGEMGRDMQNWVCVCGLRWLFGVLWRVGVRGDVWLRVAVCDWVGRGGAWYSCGVLLGVVGCGVVVMCRWARCG